jgi:hypothetical protein
MSGRNIVDVLRKLEYDGTIMFSYDGLAEEIDYDTAV